MRYRIIIDDQDAAESPESPLTLNAYRDDDDGTQSHDPAVIGPEEAIIGDSVPAMLTQLANYWHHGFVSFASDEE